MMLQQEPSTQNLLHSLETLAAQSNNNPLVTQTDVRALVTSTLQGDDAALQNTPVAPNQLRLAMLGIAARSYLANIPQVDHVLVDTIIANALALNAPAYGQGGTACYSLGAVRKGNYDRPSRIRVSVTPLDYSIVLSGYQDALDVATVFRRLNMAFSTIASVKMSLFPHDTVSGNEQIGIEIRMRSAGLRAQEADAGVPTLMSGMQNNFDQHAAAATTSNAAAATTSNAAAAAAAVDRADVDLASSLPNPKKRTLASSVYEWLTT